VIYFFSKGREYLQCEIQPGRPHVLTLVAPDGGAQSERYASGSDLVERWEQLTVDMTDDGWHGPFGRDPRD
jgi:hypothetical protein